MGYNQHKFIETDAVTYLETNKTQSLDLFLCHSGIENCNPSYSYGQIGRASCRERV